MRLEILAARVAERRRFRMVCLVGTSKRSSVVDELVGVVVNGKWNLHDATSAKKWRMMMANDDGGEL